MMIPIQRNYGVLLYRKRSHLPSPAVLRGLNAGSEQAMRVMDGWMEKAIRVFDM